MKPNENYNKNDINKYSIHIIVIDCIGCYDDIPISAIKRRHIMMNSYMP